MQKKTETISQERRHFFGTSGKLAAGSLALSGVFSTLSAKEHTALKVPV